MSLKAAPFICAQAQIDYTKARVRHGREILGVTTPFDHFNAPPPLIIGMPGIGKTQIFGGGLARALDMDLVYICPSQRDPVDINGAIMPDEIHGVAKHLIPEWKHEAITSERGAVVLLDEATNCNSSQQASLLQVAAEGLKNSIVALAANPPEQASDGNDLTPPMANRLCIMKWELDPHQWLAALTNGFRDVEFPILPPDWRLKIEETSALVSAYIQKQTSALAKYPTSDGKESRSMAGQPWPSPRSWTNAIVMLAAARSAGMGKEATGMVEHELLCGCIGDAAAKPFLQWCRALDIPDHLELLKSLKKKANGDYECKAYKRNEKRPDCTLVLCANITSWIMANLEKDGKVGQSGKECFEQGVGLLCVIAEQGDKEVACHQMSQLVNPGGALQRLMESNKRPTFPPYAVAAVTKLISKVMGGK